MKINCMLGLLPLLVLLACSNNPAGPGNEGVLTVSGTVARGAECWTIQGDNGVVYSPHGLASEYEQEGLRISAQLQPRPDWMSICMQGEIVDVLAIELE